MNIEQARENMVKQQIQTWHVLNDLVLNTIATTPREQFVPQAYRELAFSDTHIPLGHDQQMFAPREEARMLQTLELNPSDVVLEIGTGSGYCTALFAKLCQHVFTIDIIPEFTHNAMQALQANHISNVTAVIADAHKGWPEQGPYDVIAITGSLTDLPETFRDNLKIGGRLFCVIGYDQPMIATLITRISRHEWQQQSLFEMITPALINSVPPERFQF